MGFIKLSNIPTVPIISMILLSSIGILFMDESNLAFPSIVTYIGGVTVYKTMQRTTYKLSFSKKT